MDRPPLNFHIDVKRPRTRVATTAAVLMAMVGGAGAFSSATVAASKTNDPDALRFQVDEGRYLNSFLRQGPVAAHLVLRSGRSPRILVTFPAGNSGVGVWFEDTPSPVSWTLVKTPSPVTLRDDKGRILYGVVAEAQIDARVLTPKAEVLSSLRVLRDYEDTGAIPDHVRAQPRHTGATLLWSRDRLDGAPGYRLSLEVTDGVWSGGQIRAGADGKIRLRITGASGETPLTAMGGRRLLNDKAASDPKARQALDFLSYREKFLAGSWRFDTYFGRDTLMSLRLLMPVLQPEAVESGLRSVVARLSPEGEVAHEEGIGEFAVLAHEKAGQGPSDAPLFDYAMIDSTYMLAPVVSAWVIDDPRGQARATAFLKQPSGRADAPGETVGAALVRNLRMVVRQTQAFANAPAKERLLALKPGHKAGEWRDSDVGLGGGRYPYDVNAVLAPAALDAVSHLYDRGLLQPYMRAGDLEMFKSAGPMASVWRAKAPAMFEVQVSTDRARSAVKAYAAAQGVDPAPALASLKQDQGPVRFHALSLDEAGFPIPVLNSDEGFELLFSRPDPAMLAWEIQGVMRPFPAGLITPVGLLVANPVNAGPGLQAILTRNAYHGLVIWSWQQALLAAGLDRQLRRADLPPRLRSALVADRLALWKAIEAGRSMANSELWSWRVENGRYQIALFGPGTNGAGEANAAQLWSTVYLAVQPPKRLNVRKNR